MCALDRGITELRKGRMVVLYDDDGREGEADLAIHADFVSPKAIQTLRKDAGGLICLALDRKIARMLGLPFFTDILEASGHPIAMMECTKTAYGDRPAFAIPVNHKMVYTGITDNDRSLTIKRIAEIVKETRPREVFMQEFYSPGHVFLLIGRGIRNRRGHTELSLELARRAGMSGLMVLCEMLGQGKALSKEKAKQYANKNRIPFIEGRELL